MTPVDPAQEFDVTGLALRFLFTRQIAFGSGWPQMSRFCGTRWLKLLRRRPVLIGRLLLKLLSLALRLLLAGALLLLLRLLAHGTLLLAHGVFVLALHLVLLTVQFRLLALQLLLRPLRLFRRIAFIRRPCIGRRDWHTAISWLLIALQFLLAALRRLLLLCLLAHQFLLLLCLLLQRALLPQGGFALQTLRSLRARHL